MRALTQPQLARGQRDWVREEPPWPRVGVGAILVGVGAWVWHVSSNYLTQRDGPAVCLQLRVTMGGRVSEWVGGARQGRG